MSGEPPQSAPTPAMFVLDGHCLVGLQPLTQTLSLPHCLSSPECYSAPACFSCLCISCICSFFTTTPKALIQGGLYKQLALPLFPGEQDRKGSLAMTAKVGLGFKDARQHSLRGEWLCAAPYSCALVVGGGRFFTSILPMFAQGWGACLPAFPTPCGQPGRLAFSLVVWGRYRWSRQRTRRMSECCHSVGRRRYLYRGICSHCIRSTGCREHEHTSCALLIVTAVRMRSRQS